MSCATLNLTLYKGTTFGPVKLYVKDTAGQPIPLAGWSAKSQVRKFECGPVILDLAPTISPTDTEGLITLREVPTTETALLEEVIAMWDILLTDPALKTFPPLLGGKFTISLPVSQ